MPPVPVFLLHQVSNVQYTQAFSTRFKLRTLPLTKVVHIHSSEAQDPDQR